MSTVQGGQGNIVTNGLVLNLDAANPRSYPQPYNGTTWQNIAPVSSSLTGSLVNGVGYTGSNGGALTFDGVDDYVDCGTSPSLDFGTGSATIGTWFKTSNNTGALCTKRQGSGFQLYVFSGKLYADGAGVSTGASSLSNVNTNTWVYGVVVYDRNSSLVRLYVNGIADGTTVLGGTTLTDVGNCNIGRATLGSPRDYYTGNIPLVQIYNRALNASEVLQNFNATRARFGV
jgi:hypothetical protein